MSWKTGEVGRVGAYRVLWVLGRTVDFILREIGSSGLKLLLCASPKCFIHNISLSLMTI